MGTDPFFLDRRSRSRSFIYALCDPFPDPDPPFVTRSFADPYPDLLFLTRYRSRSLSDPDPGRPINDRDPAQH